MEPKTIQGNLFTDDRGTIRFINDFDPYTSGIRRIYHVQDHQVNYIRAFHGHLRENKYVYVAKGTALIAAAKLEYDENIKGYCLSQTANKFVLSDTTPKILFIPKGYANGFKTLEQGTIITFYSTSTLEESKGDDIRFDYNTLDIWKEDYR
jgi:dTDP-4-dehydrorhamnose 3,5-epimerase